MCIHEKCGTASRVRNILSKVLIILVFLVKILKTTPTVYNLFTVWFPKELVGHDFPSLRSQNRVVFTLLPFHGYWKLEGAVQTEFRHGQGRRFLHKRPPRLAHSRRTWRAHTHSKLHGNVINPLYYCWLVWTRSCSKWPRHVNTAYCNFLTNVWHDSVRSFVRGR